jgi:hypothetical protein
MQFSDSNYFTQFQHLHSEFTAANRQTAGARFMWLCFSFRTTFHEATCNGCFRYIITILILPPIPIVTMDGYRGYYSVQWSLQALSGVSLASTSQVRVFATLLFPTAWN